jgi:hypothetical protein
MPAAVGEADPRAQHQHLHGAGHQDLAGLSQRGDPGAGVHGQTCHRGVPAFHLAGMQAGPDVDADFPHGVPDGTGAPDGPGGPVEGDEEAVPGGVDLAAPEPRRRIAPASSLGR